MDSVTQRLMMGAAGAGGAAKVYVEDVFSTWLYTGTGSTQAITNGIDLAGKGGLVWRKNRNLTTGAISHYLHDTVRSPQSGMPTSHRLSTDLLNGQFSDNDYITSWNSDGFSFGTGNPSLSGSGNTVASWTFRKAEKFFDVVTWTGDGTDGRQIAHSLGSTPGCVIIKRTDSAIGWAVYHRSLTTTYGVLNETSAFATSQLGGYNMQEVFGNSSTVILPDASKITVARFSPANASGGTYVAYLFAHDAGGFGDSGNDSVVSCGSYTGNGSTTSPPTINLGWEPQWILIKESSGIRDWYVVDNMRGLSPDGGGSETKTLNPNLSDAEGSFTGGVWITPTGFRPSVAGIGNVNSANYIYIAIRRGPMKTPTDATKVFSSLAITTSVQTTGTVRTTNFPVDMMLSTARTITLDRYVSTKLLGGFPNSDVSCPNLRTSSTVAEGSNPSMAYDAWNTTIKDGSFYGVDSIRYFFRRAPGYFDVVAYAGTGANRTVNHNLGVTPELMIVKSRSSSYNWYIYSSGPGATKYATLNTANQFFTLSEAWNDTAPTSTVFSVGTNLNTNGSGSTFIAYLFATCPGVSKVGSYTGTGTTLNIDCGFTNGARFVLIKRTNSTGDWYVWDTARGIVSGNDPYLLMNSTTAEVTNTDYIDPLSSGFQISSTAPAAINANGGSFIYLAIA